MKGARERERGEERKTSTRSNSKVRIVCLATSYTETNGKPCGRSGDEGEKTRFFRTRTHTHTHRRPYDVFAENMLD